jgi:hypothetical protein
MMLAASFLSINFFDMSFSRLAFLMGEGISAQPTKAHATTRKKRIARKLIPRKMKTN